MRRNFIQQRDIGGTWKEKRIREVCGNISLMAHKYLLIDCIETIGCDTGMDSTYVQGTCDTMTWGGRERSCAMLNALT